MKKRYIPSILIVLCLLIAACVGAAYAKYVSVKKAENLFHLSANVKSEVKTEAYAAYSDATKTLYFLNDVLIKEGEDIPGANDTATAVYTGILGSDIESVNGWIAYAESIETVRFLDDIAPNNIQYWFYGCTKLKAIDGMAKHLETINVQLMDYTFAGCIELTVLDLSGFKTEKVTDMNHMFSNCSKLVTIYATESFVLSDTVIRWGSDGLFEGCTSLVGGKGTPFDSRKTDDAYARIDGGTTAPGYFTLKGASTFAVEPTCTCENKCEEQNEDCEVCKTDITFCEGAETPAGEELTCSCVTKCAELTEACEVCKTDITNCEGAEAPAGEELTCSCGTKCAELNEACEVCKTDITNCKGTEAPSGEELTCSCETKCAELNEACEVCKTDITNCKGTEAPSGEELTCSCETKCTELNEACEVCKTDIVNCNGTEAPTGEELTCSCETKCSEPNEACGVCKTDITNCKGAEAPAGEELTCSCGTKCSEPTEACEVCKTDITNCNGTESSLPSAASGGDVITNPEETTSPAEQESTESQEPTEPVNASADPVILTSESTEEDEGQQGAEK